MTAQGTERVVETWSNNTTRATRSHHHGRIEPMVERPVFTVLGFVGGVALLVASLVGIIAAVLLVQAVVSISHEPPATGLDANTSASRGTPPSSIVSPDAANRGPGR